MIEAPDVADLGRCPFEFAYAEMLATVEQIRGGATGRILLVEHDPVYTAGRKTPRDQLRDGIIAIERGGQITYHGPGQLVIYPIVRLPTRDVRAWLRSLEAFGVAICAQFGLTGTPSVDGTGVFVDDAAGGHRKVASIGVAIRHWINLHGMSINVDMDLTAFDQIRPCGLDPEIMTDLSRTVGRRIPRKEAIDAAVASLPALLGSGYASGE